MSKKLALLASFLLLGGSFLPGIAQAVTVNNVLTTDSSVIEKTSEHARTPEFISPLNELTESSGTESLQPESPSEEAVESTEDSTEASTTETSSEESETESSEEPEKLNKTPRGPRADTDFLIEGDPADDPSTYDIDRNLSTCIRNGHRSGLTWPTNMGFTGRNKTAGKLTFGDMKTLTSMTLAHSHHTPSLNPPMGSLKGFDYAINLEQLYVYALPEHLMDDGTFNLPFPKLKKFQTYALKYKRIQSGVLEDLVYFRSDLSDIFEKYDGVNYPNLEELNINTANLAEIDLSFNPKLIRCVLGKNPLEYVDFSGNPAVEQIALSQTKISSFDVSGCYKLVQFTANDNRICDIRTAVVMQPTTTAIGNALQIDRQTIYAPVKLYPGETDIVIDVLKTTNQQGLTATNGTITGTPGITVTGDVIKVSNITGEAVDGKYVNFKYDGNFLAEGEAAGILPSARKFSGKIYFQAVSELKTQLTADKERVNTGDTVNWKWTIDSLTTANPKDAAANLALPSGLAVVPGSVEVDGVAVADSVLANPINITGMSGAKTITFKTVATGNAEEWLEAKGTVDWDDSTDEGPYHIDTADAVQIQDEEETHIPQPEKDMGILAAPIRFDYGVVDFSESATVHNLKPENYETNTNVVNNGFYTRVKDDRSVSTGWKLTASLSKFTDVKDSTTMPYWHGSTLRFEGMSVEKINDRDTPEEAVDPAPTAVPGTVKTSEAIVAGEGAKTLVSALPFEGQGTWQLRIPFDKVYLDLPANAGRTGHNYQAKLTWSLDDTP